MSIVQVGNRTLVSKITYGTPFRTAVITSNADIDAITGLVTSGSVDGSLFIYDSATSTWRPYLTLSKQIIDGREYPSDSDRAQILIRRSGTQGDPLVLRTGELAYSYLSDSGSAADGFGAGGDRLFIGAGGDSSVGGVLQAQRIEVIGGKYFTDLLNHPHGTLTASSAIIVDSTGSVDILRTDALFADSANISGLYVGDSALINNLQVLSVLTINDLLAVGDATLNNVTINGALNVQGAATFDSSVSINDLTVDSNLSVAGTATFADGFTAAGVAFFDSAVVKTLRIDSNLSVPGELSVTGATTFDSAVTLNGAVNIGDRTLSEFIDSDVFQLLRAGQAITLTYSDDSDKLTIAVPTATTNTPGVVFFDSEQFSVSVEGLVTAQTLTGGTF